MSARIKDQKAKLSIPYISTIQQQHLLMKGSKKMSDCLTKKGLLATLHLGHILMAGTVKS